MNKIIEFGSNIIKISETSSGYEVNVTADKNTNIYVNEKFISIENKNDICSFVPENMKKFISENLFAVSSGNYNNKMYNCAEVSILDRDLAFYFPENKAYKVIAGFTLSEPLDTVFNSIEQSFKGSKHALLNIKMETSGIYYKMLLDLERLGYELIYSGLRNEGFYGWYNIEFNACDFDENRFLNACHIIFDYNDKFKDIKKKYNLI